MFSVLTTHNFDQLIVHENVQARLAMLRHNIEGFFKSCTEAHERILGQRLRGIRKDSPESAVTLVDIPGSPRICVKELRWRGWAHALKGLVRPSRGLRTYRNGWQLINAGISAPAPLGLSRRMCLGLARVEWIFMEVFPTALELDRYVLRRAAVPWRIAERRGFARAFGRFIGGLHAKGIFHSDLKTCNILVTDEAHIGGQPGAIRFSLLDYDDVIFSRTLSLKKRVKNLAQIFLSTPMLLGISDRVRFVRAYADEAKLDRDETRELVGAVLSAVKGRRILYVGLDGDVVEDWS